MNVPPMILRFASGSSCPASAARNSSDASTVTTSTSSALPPRVKAASTSSRSCRRSRPLSTNTQVRRSPIARERSAAATLESTPPESPSTTRPSPTWARTLATASSTMCPGVHDPAQPQMSRANRRTISAPRAVCVTSGWNWTPNRRRAGSVIAATGALSVCAVTANPGGTAVTLSPWLIQTGMRPPSVSPSRSGSSGAASTSA